jgi:protein tyrosine phosphatase (PTP) superfamily phosphohydrolase (DUF442 family)
MNLSVKAPGLLSSATRRQRLFLFTLALAFQGMFAPVFALNDDDSLRIMPPGNSSGPQQAPPQDDGLRILPPSSDGPAPFSSRSHDASAPFKPAASLPGSGSPGLLPSKCGALDVGLLKQASNAILNFHVVAPWLLRGAQPTAQNLQLLKSAGVRTIINLRNEPILIQQEAQQARALGLAYVNIPLDVFNPPTDAQVRHFISCVSDSKTQPVFVHCLHGQDRTGTMVAMYRIDREGWAADQAYQEMLQDGYRPMFFVLTRAVFDYSAQHGRPCPMPAVTDAFGDVKNRLSKFLHH